jgi:TusA-related sulfurtransferase
MLETPTQTTEATPAITRTIDARGSFCPGPLMELIRAIREAQVGDVLAVLSSDRGSKVDIPKWVEKAGHRLVGITSEDGVDQIVVEKLR